MQWKFKVRRLFLRVVYVLRSLLAVPYATTYCNMPLMLLLACEIGVFYRLSRYLFDWNDQTHFETYLALNSAPCITN